MRRLAHALLIVGAMSGSVDAQRVVLELRPRAGDTLRMELDQVTEMTSGSAAAPSTVTTTLKMFSRAIVESSARIASLILAVTDSVDVSSTDPDAKSLGEQAERDLEGRQMRLRLWPDGTVTLNDGNASVPREVSDLVSVMPASFPSKPVKVGETWTREMPVPTGDNIGIPEGSVVRTKFRLDSLSVDTSMAYVSMNGTLVPPRTTAKDAVAGSVNGSLVVNRRRGWLSESHFLLLLKSTVARATKSAFKDDLIFSVKVTQSMRVLRTTPTRIPR